MVVLSQPAPLEQFSPMKTYKPTLVITKSDTKNKRQWSGIPAIDISSPDARSELVKACEEFGFFKVINHGIPIEFMNRLEEEAYKFFNMSQCVKEKAGSPSPFGYGNKRIGPNGDVGWLEYLLLSANTDFISRMCLAMYGEKTEDFSSAVKKYVTAVKKMAYRILELLAEGLMIEHKDRFSRMLMDENSDSCFRLNHYPPCPSELEAVNGGELIGFGEHTDPQIISILRSNNTAGLEISVGEGNWLPVSPDRSSFFVNVGDCLQVMTNGRFKSVKHRVVAQGKRSRISMIFFGGPPLSEKITPLECLMEEEEESFYNEFTWWEYKTAAYKSKLADNRLAHFEKKNSINIEKKKKKKGQVAQVNMTNNYDNSSGNTK